MQDVQKYPSSADTKILPETSEGPHLVEYNSKTTSYSNIATAASWHHLPNSCRMTDRLTEAHTT